MAHAREREALQDLRHTGRRIDARFREVRTAFSDDHRIVAQWHDPTTNKVYVFESDPIGYDPSEFLRDTVPVFIDPADPRHYLVDTSVFPSPGNVPAPEDSA